MEYYRTFFLVAQFLQLRRQYDQGPGELSQKLIDAFSVITAPYTQIPGTRVPSALELHSAVPQCLSVHFVQYENLGYYSRLDQDQARRGSTAADSGAETTCELQVLADFLGICGVNDDVAVEALKYSTPSSMRATFGNKAFGFNKRYFDESTGQLRKFEEKMSSKDVEQTTVLMKMLMPSYFGYNAQ